MNHTRKVNHLCNLNKVIIMLLSFDGLHHYFQVFYCSSSLPSKLDQVASYGERIAVDNIASSRHFSRDSVSEKHFIQMLKACRVFSSITHQDIIFLPGWCRSSFWSDECDKGRCDSPHSLLLHTWDGCIESNIWPLAIVCSRPSVFVGFKWKNWDGCFFLVVSVC